MDRVDQPMSIALGCSAKINWLVALISVRVAYVEAISHELEVVRLKRTKTVMYSSFNPVERRARSIAFPS